MEIEDFKNSILYNVLKFEKTGTSISISKLQMLVKRDINPDSGSSLPFKNHWNKDNYMDADKFNNTFLRALNTLILQGLIQKVTDDTKNYQSTYYKGKDTVRGWKKLIKLNVDYLKDCPKEIANELGKGAIKGAYDLGIMEAADDKEIESIMQQCISLLKAYTFHNKKRIINDEDFRMRIIGDSDLVDRAMKTLKDAEIISYLNLKPKWSNLKKVKGNYKGISVIWSNEEDWWERILKTDASYLADCPTETAIKLGYEKLKTLNNRTGILENVSDDTLEKKILAKLNSSPRVFANKVVDEEIGPKKTVILYDDAVKYGNLKIKIIKIFQQLQAEGVIVKDENDGSYILKSKVVERWKNRLEKNPEDIYVCPKWILDILKPNVSNARETGVFENQNYKNDLLAEILVLLWERGSLLDTAMVSRFISEYYDKVEDLDEEIRDVFQKIQEMGFAKVALSSGMHELVMQDWNEIHDLSINDILDKNDIETPNQRITKMEVEIWQTILSLDFKYVSQCPKVLLPYVVKNNNLRKTVDMGVFENNKHTDLMCEILYCLWLHEKILTSQITIGGDCTIDEVNKIFQEIAKMGLGTYRRPDGTDNVTGDMLLVGSASAVKDFDFKTDDADNDRRWKEAMQDYEKRIWKAILDLDFTYIDKCPKELIDKLDIHNNLKKPIQMGVFENMTFKSLLNSAPAELRDIVWQQWKAPQNPKFHPEGNTLKHIMTVVKRAILKYPDNINIILAAFFHDLGKFKSLGWKNGVPTQHGHEDVSAELVKKYADWIKELGGDVDEVYFIVANHMKIKPNVWDVMRASKKEKIEKEKSFDDLMKFGQLDKGGLSLENFEVEKVEFDYTDWSNALNESAADDFTPEFAPEMAGELVDKDKIERFMFAGKAIFTIRNNQTQNRFTYRVMRPKKIEDDVYFVSVLTGGDNNSMYSFFGTIFDKTRFKLSAKAKVATDSMSVKAFMWFWKTLLSNNPFPPQIQIWHEGVCGKCGKKLTVPESIDIGLGPICAKSAQLWERSKRLVDTNNAIGIFEKIDNTMLHISKYNNFLNESEEKKEKKEKMKQLTKDWEEVYKLNKKVAAALRKMHKEGGYDDKSNFETKVKETLSRFEISDLKVKKEESSYVIKFKIKDNVFNFEFFANGKLKEAFEGEQEIKKDDKNVIKYKK